MRYFFFSFFFGAVLLVSYAGFRGHRFQDEPFQIFPDMKDQAKVKYQVPSNFFADGQAMRKPVAGTVPVGYAEPNHPASQGFEAGEYEFGHGDTYYFTGKKGDFYGDGFPEELGLKKFSAADWQAFLERGQQRFNINCSICHGVAGNGKGIFTKYTTVQPADFTGPGFDDKSNAALYRPDGKIFDVITNGWNQMGSYGANVSVKDRWAIIAYIRTLQTASKNSAK